jgi:anti-sigma regulatory factor (Ser/Thr protein kinase)
VNCLHLCLEPVGEQRLVYARDRLRRWLVQAGVPEPALHEILIAAGEACANAVEHSGVTRSGPRCPISIDARLTSTGVRLVVADRGRWRPPGRTQNRGRGRMLMNHLVDHMQLDSGPEGTTVELVKHMPAGFLPPCARTTRARRLDPRSLGDRSTGSKTEGTTEGKA